MIHGQYAQDNSGEFLLIRGGIADFYHSTHKRMEILLKEKEYRNNEKPKIREALSLLYQCDHSDVDEAVFILEAIL